MKKSISILLTLLCSLSTLCLMSCRRTIVPEGYQNTIVDTVGEFVVSYDTLYIDPSWLTPDTYLDVYSVVRYHDRYYCYCTEQDYRSAHIYTRSHLFSFATDGRDFRDLGELLWGSNFRDLGDVCFGSTLVRNDSLLFVTKKYELYLDTLTWQWDSVSVNNIWYDRSIVFDEDDDYYLAYSDHGEFGYYTSFISKTTGQDYVWFMYPKRLFRYDNRYFNLLPTALQWVDDPTKGVEHPGKFLELKYEESKARTFVWADNKDRDWLSDYFIQFDPSYVPDTVFLNAFVWDNALQVLTNAPDETYIARWQNDSLQKVMSFGHRFDFNHYVFSGIEDNPHLPKNEALLWFNDNYRTSGIVDVVDNYIHITYLECDVDTAIQYLGFESIEPIISFYRENFLNLTPERVDSFEHQIGALDNVVSPQTCTNCNEIFYFHYIDSIRSLRIKISFLKEDCSPLCVDFTLCPTHFVEDNYRYVPDSVLADSRIWEIFYRQFGDVPYEKSRWSVEWHKPGCHFVVDRDGTNLRFWNEKK